MIPQTSDLTIVDVQTQPSYTYKFDLDNKVICGMTDNQQAIVQMIRKVLGTERFAFAIYNADYGTELQYLIGKPIDYITSEVKRVVSEALLVDDRVTGITEFKTEVIRLDSLFISFLVSTVHDSVRIETEVTIQ